MEYLGVLCVTVSCVNSELAFFLSALDFKHCMDGLVKPTHLPLEETIVEKMSEVILNVSSWKSAKLEVIAMVKTTPAAKQLNQFMQKLNYTSTHV